jgi:flagellar hook-length control protein FliK
MSVDIQMINTVEVQENSGSPGTSDNLEKLATVDNVHTNRKDIEPNKTEQDDDGNFENRFQTELEKKTQEKLEEDGEGSVQSDEGEKIKHDLKEIGEQLGIEDFSELMTVEEFMALVFAAGQGQGDEPFTALNSNMNLSADVKQSLASVLETISPEVLNVLQKNVMAKETQSLQAFLESLPEDVREHIKGKIEAANLKTSADPELRDAVRDVINTGEKNASQLELNEKAEIKVLSKDLSVIEQLPEKNIPNKEQGIIDRTLLLKDDKASEPLQMTEKKAIDAEVLKVVERDGRGFDNLFEHKHNSKENFLPNKAEVSTLSPDEIKTSELFSLEGKEKSIDELPYAKKINTDGILNVDQGGRSNIQVPGLPISASAITLTQGIGTTSQAEQVMPYTDHNTVEIVKQVTKGILSITTDSIKEIRLQLVPEYLGKVQISMELKSDVMSGKIAVENDAVRQVVEANLGQLRESVESQNIKLDSLEVTVNQERAFLTGKNEAEERKAQSRQNSSQRNGDANLSEDENAQQETGRRLGYNTIELVA